MVDIRTKEHTWGARLYILLSKVNENILSMNYVVLETKSDEDQGTYEVKIQSSNSGHGDECRKWRGSLSGDRADGVGVNLKEVDMDCHSGDGSGSGGQISMLMVTTSATCQRWVEDDLEMVWGAFYHPEITFLLIGGQARPGLLSGFLELWA
ncbi:hypothetical protein F5I97DRAFT_1828270 [Phlebopus sp. FC_14]|nr:hypothetical protein F5I97DRAFT_1828270 [Phlebopus sp. FC_14]